MPRAKLPAASFFIPSLNRHATSGGAAAQSMKGVTALLGAMCGRGHVFSGRILTAASVVAGTQSREGIESLFRDCIHGRTRF